MTRAYAIALAAGTQVLTLGIGGAVFGTAVLTRPGPGRRVGGQPRGGRVRHPPQWPPAVVRSVRPSRWAPVNGVVGPPAGRLRAAGRRAPRPALVGRLGGLDLAHDADGTTTLTGAVADQAELHGILTRIRDLGVTLISVAPVDPPRTP